MFPFFPILTTSTLEMKRLKNLHKILFTSKENIFNLCIFLILYSIYGRMEQVCAEAAAEKIRDREKLQSEHTNGDAGKFL